MATEKITESLTQIETVGSTADDIDESSLSQKVIELEVGKGENVNDEKEDIVNDSVEDLRPTDPMEVTGVEDEKGISVIDEKVNNGHENVEDNKLSDAEEGTTKEIDNVSITNDAVEQNVDETEKVESVQVKDDVPLKNDLVDEEESDGEIVDSDTEDVGEKVHKEVDFVGLDDVVRPELDQLDYDEDVDESDIKDDANEKKGLEAQNESKEMSDGEIASSDGEVKSDSEDKKSSQIRFGEDYEEGEMIDPTDGPSLPRETCRFFERGNCTWGDRCRFIHPGVNDKGGYKMFEDEKARPPFPGPPSLRFPPPLDPRGHPMPPRFPPAMMFGPPPPETAWERGLRHAKEMRRRSMQRKVEEPDFMRKREVLSLNEALNVDRDMDYIAHKPLAGDEGTGDPFNNLEEDERYAVPSVEDVKKLKRLGKGHTRSGGKSPNHDVMRRRPSPRPQGHMRREMEGRNRERRSPPRHPPMGLPHGHDRHQPVPMPHPDDKMSQQHLLPHMRHDYRDRRDAGGDRARHEREFRDRRMAEGVKERDYRMEQSRGFPLDDARGLSPRRREIESRVVPVDPQSGKRKNVHSGRGGDAWNDPWARGRQSTKRRPSRSDSESSGSSSSSSRSSYSSRSGSSFSSRSSSRSSYSSSYSSSASSRSPSPKNAKKVVKTKKKTVAKSVATKAGVKASPKPKLPAAAGNKPTANTKKTAEMVRAKLAKPAVAKPAPKPALPPAVKPVVRVTADKPPERGRPPVKALPKKGKQTKYDSSSSSEFSHSSSSESRSRSRSKGKESDSDSDSGSSSDSSSGSESYSSSSSSSSAGSSDDEKTKKPKAVKKKNLAAKPAAATAEKKPVGKITVPSKPGNKNVKMSIADKVPTGKLPAPPESRKRSAAAMSNAPGKKAPSIANRRVELLEQLKVVENAILKKRAKLT